MDEDQDEKLHQATATSSPLTDVYDLKSRSESNKSSDSEADDSDKISESRPVEMEDIQPERSIDEYRKKSETSSDDDRGMLSNFCLLNRFSSFRKVKERFSCFRSDDTFG
jgi:hypothetical protein